MDLYEMNRRCGRDMSDECDILELGWRPAAQMHDESADADEYGWWGYDHESWIQEVWHLYA